MKRISTIFFIGIILTQVVGCYVYFASRLVAIRHEMREQLKTLPDEELTKFIFTEAEFRKSKVNDHEFKVNGKMHDIARMEHKGNEIHIYAMHDEAEDDLLAFFSEMASRSAKDKKPVPTQLVKLISLQFIKSEISWGSISNELVVHHTNYYAHESNVIRFIDSPPPRGWFLNYFSQQHLLNEVLSLHTDSCVFLVNKFYYLRNEAFTYHAFHALCIEFFCTVCWKGKQ